MKPKDPEDNKLGDTSSHPLAAGLPTTLKQEHSDENANQRSVFKADPKKLPSRKKAKYYGVRIGANPGIYYTWSGHGGAQEQVKGFRDAVFISFTSADEVEHFDNHDSNHCKKTYKTCWPLCRAQAAQQSQRFSQRDGLPSAATPAMSERKPDRKPDGTCFQCGVVLPRKEATTCLACRIAQHSLSEEQAGIVRTIAHGSNVFYTGAAGTGKSIVLRATVEHLRDIGRTVDVIAFTGIAAYNASGRTLHSYAGWDIAAQGLSMKALGDKVFMKKTRKRLQATNVLIIDEISMVSSSVFTRLDYILREVRAWSDSDKARAFGGVQLVVTGDFYQLPPVKPFSHCCFCGLPMSTPKRQQRSTGGPPAAEYICGEHGTFKEAHKYAFSSASWKECAFKCLLMNQIRRQSDQVFTGILNRIRTQACSKADAAVLLNHKQNVAEDAIKIFCLRVDVDFLNETKLDEIRSRKLTFAAVDGFLWHEERHPDLKGSFGRVDGENSPLLALSGQDRHRFGEVFEMKLGMKVVLLVNLDFDRGLVNGSQGKVVGFTKSSDQPSGLSDGPPQKRNKNGLFEHYGYARREEMAFTKRAEKDNLPPKDGKGLDELWPVVHFENNVETAVFPYCAITELGADAPHSLISRTQLPLAAGWAVTAHKSQGMTLEQVTVDMGHTFEHGQAYVALSRARTLEGLKVVDLSERDVGADEEVTEFMDKTFGADILVADMEMNGDDDEDEDLRGVRLAFDQGRHCRYPS